jgi:hypothetical protein
MRALMHAFFPISLLLTRFPLFGLFLVIFEEISNYWKKPSDYFTEMEPNQELEAAASEGKFKLQPLPKYPDFKPHTPLLH